MGHCNPWLKMWSFKIITMIASVLLVLGLKPATAIPSSNDNLVATSLLSKDYLTLHDILGKHLAGTTTEKAKVVDLLLQLLEEIDLTTLCEVIKNDTKGQNNVFSRVPIKSTKIDTKLLNEMRAQMTNDLQGIPTPLNNAVNVRQETTLVDSNIQLTDDNNQKSINQGKEASTDDTTIPATYKYHRNEMRNVDLGFHGNRKPNGNRINFDNVKKSKLASSSVKSGNLNMAIKNDDFLSKRSREKQAHDRTLSFPDLPKEDKFSKFSINLDPAQSKRELKQMYLRSIGGQFQDNRETVNTNGVKYKNLINKKLNFKRPRTQLFAQPLALGDWLSDKRTPNQNREKKLLGNGKRIQKDDINNMDNYVEEDTKWLHFDEHENQKHVIPTKQSKRNDMFWQNEGTGRQILEPWWAKATSKDERNTQASDLNIPQNQHEVDYLEELRSTFRANKQAENQSKGHHNVDNENIGYKEVYPEDETEEAIAEKSKYVTPRDTVHKVIPNMQNHRTTPLMKNVNEFIKNGDLNKHLNIDFPSSKIDNEYIHVSEIKSTSQSLLTTGIPRRFVDATNGKLNKNMPPTHYRFPTSTTHQTDLKSRLLDRSVIPTTSPESTMRSDEFLQNESHEINANKIFATMEPQSISLATHNTNGFLFNSAAPSQQKYVSINPRLAHEYDRLSGENRQTTVQQQKTISIITNIGNTGSSTSLHQKSTTQDHVTSTPEIQTSSTTTDSPTYSDTEYQFLTTIFPQIEAKMKDVNPISASRLSVEEIQNIHTTDIKTIEQSRSEGDKIFFHADLANVKEIYDSASDDPQDSSTALRDTSNTKLPSTEATGDAGDRSIFTAIYDFGNNMSSNYKTELENVDNVSPENRLSKSEYLINNNFTDEGSDIKDTVSEKVSNLSLISTINSTSQFQTTVNVSEILVTPGTQNILPGTQTNTSQRATVVTVNNFEPSSRLFIESVVMTTAKMGDINFMATKTEENDLNKTSNDVPSFSSDTTTIKQDASSPYTSTYQSTMGTITGGQQPGKSTKTITTSSINVTHLFNEPDDYAISTSQTHIPISPKDPPPRTQSLHREHSIPDTSTTIDIDSFNLSASPKPHNQTSPSTTESYQITNTDSTNTTGPITLDMITSDNTSKFSQTISQQTADFDNLIQPVFIDYGDSRQHIKMIKPTTASTNSDLSPIEIIDIVPNIEFITTASTQLSEEVIASQNKNIRAKGTDDAKEESLLYSIDEINNDSRHETDIVKITSSEKAIIDTPSNLLRQLPHENITADRIKMIASKVAQTKANLSEININMLKQSAKRAQQKHAIEKDATNETVANKTVANETVANETVANETVANKTVANETVANETVANKTVANETVANKTVANKTVANETVANETVANKTVANKTVANKTVANETVANETVANETVANETVANETVANETVANKTVANETVANKTVANETVANKTVANKTVNVMDGTVDAHISIDTREAKEQNGTLAASTDRPGDSTTYENKATRATTLHTTNTEPEKYVSTELPMNEKIISKTISSIVAEKVTEVSTSYSIETSTPSLRVTTDKTVNTEKNHQRDLKRTTINDYPADNQPTHLIKSDQVNDFTGLDTNTNVRQDFNTRSNGYDLSHLTHESNTQYKPKSRPHISRYSDLMFGPNIQTKSAPLQDSWKTYNIALSKSKTQQFDREMNDYTNVPEILLYSDYKNTPPIGENNAMSYLWKARPWAENKKLQNNKYNALLTDKSELYQSKNSDDKNPVHTHAKILNKIKSAANIANAIKHTKEWGNRFSQGYYGRVFDGQRSFTNTKDDSADRLPFYSREMINFDLQNKDSQDIQEYAEFQAEKNKHPILNRGRKLKPFDSKVLNRNQKIKGNKFNFPSYPGRKAHQQNQKAPGYASLGNDRKVSYLAVDNPAANHGLNGEEIEKAAVLETGDVIQWNGDHQATDDYKCPGLFGYHRDPLNCQAFFICSWGMPHRVVCPQGTLYNSKEAVCDWAVNVQCSDTSN